MLNHFGKLCLNLSLHSVNEAMEAINIILHFNFTLWRFSISHFLLEISIGFEPFPDNRIGHFLCRKALKLIEVQYCNQHFVLGCKSLYNL